MTRTFIDGGHRWLGYNENGFVIAYRVTKLDSTAVVIEGAEPPKLPTGRPPAYPFNEEIKTTVEAILKEQPWNAPKQFHITDTEATTEQQANRLWHDHFTHDGCVTEACETHNNYTTHVKRELDLKTLDGTTVTFKLCAHEDDTSGVYGYEFTVEETTKHDEQLSFMCFPVEFMDQLAGWLTSTRERVDAQ